MAQKKLQIIVSIKEIAINQGYKIREILSGGVQKEFHGL